MRDSWHHDVEEIHAVHFELIAEGHIVLQVAEVFGFLPVGQFMNHYFSSVPEYRGQCRGCFPSGIVAVEHYQYPRSAGQPTELNR